MNSENIYSREWLLANGFAGHSGRECFIHSGKLCVHDRPSVRSVEVATGRSSMDGSPSVILYPETADDMRALIRMLGVPQ